MPSPKLITEVRLKYEGKLYFLHKRLNAIHRPSDGAIHIEDQFAEGKYGPLEKPVDFSLSIAKRLHRVKDTTLGDFTEEDKKKEHWKEMRRKTNESTNNSES